METIKTNRNKTTMKITTNFTPLRRNLLHRTVKNKFCSIRHIHTRSLSHRYSDTLRRGYFQRHHCAPALTCTRGCQRMEGGTNSTCEGPRLAGYGELGEAVGVPSPAVGTAPPFLFFLRRQRPSQTLQWGSRWWGPQAHRLAGSQSCSPHPSERKLGFAEAMKVGQGD